jgi:hypothetical protein
MGVTGARPSVRREMGEKWAKAAKGANHGSLVPESGWFGVDPPGLGRVGTLTGASHGRAGAMHRRHRRGDLRHEGVGGLRRGPHRFHQELPHWHRAGHPLHPRQGRYDPVRHGPRLAGQWGRADRQDAEVRAFRRARDRVAHDARRSGRADVEPERDRSEGRHARNAPRSRRLCAEDDVQDPEAPEARPARHALMPRRRHGYRTTGAVRYGVLASGKLWEGGRDLNSETFR